MVCHTTEEGFRNLHSFFLRALKIPRLSRFLKISPSFIQFSSLLFSSVPTFWSIIPRFLRTMAAGVTVKSEVLESSPPEGVCSNTVENHLVQTNFSDGSPNKYVSNNSRFLLSMNSCTVFSQNQFFFFSFQFIILAITLLILDNFCGWETVDEE